MGERRKGLLGVYDVLVGYCKKRDSFYLPYNDARGAIQWASGFSFPNGTTIDDLFAELGGVDLIKVVDSFNGQKYIVPLELKQEVKD